MYQPSVVFLSVCGRSECKGSEERYAGREEAESWMIKEYNRSRAIGVFWGNERMLCQTEAEARCSTATAELLLLYI